LKTEEIVELASDLRNKLTQLGVNFKPNTNLDAVPVHLADIYEISIAYQYLIDELLEVRPSQKNEATQLTEQIHHHLYEHLPYHLKHLPKGLDDLTKRLKRKKKGQAKKSY
jgi:DNA repair ATPase RecN